ncbi:lipopolysaccharide biosynthesis protein [Vibrio breoganii]
MTLFAKLIRESFKVFTGNTLSSVLNILTIMIITRYLGLSEFGIFTLVITYCVFVDAIFNFQSWQALIKYCQTYLEKKDYLKFSYIIKVLVKFDLWSAVLAFVIINSTSIYFFSYYDVGHEYKNLSLILSFSVLLNFTGVPIGILRLVGDFNSIIYHNLIIACSKLISSLAVVYFNFNIFELMTLWALSEVIGRVFLMWKSFYVVRNKIVFHKENNSNYTMAILCPGILKFMFSTNLNSSIRLSSREADIFLVGAIFSIESVAIYKVAKQISNIIMKFVDPLYQIIYPELVKLVNSNEIRQMAWYIVKSTALIAFFSIACIVILKLYGVHLIEVTFGQEYTESANVIFTYIYAILICAIGFWLQPLMVSIGKPHYSLFFNIISTTIYFVVIIIFGEKIGLIGVAIAYVIYYGVWSLLMLSSILYHFHTISKKRHLI